MTLLVRSNRWILSGGVRGGSVPMLLDRFYRRRLHRLLFSDLGFAFHSRLGLTTDLPKAGLTGVFTGGALMAPLRR